ncbi:uncharacterized protein LOC116418031 [Nasonia vitripennis]|uniref:Uncharacterized protein n=1 Tax=Nasonia vitripennis TaxID=7425 RepID=A0A7M7QM74_NASVI|nr:uncharacterized protein LOC116418031 [Nasonia vitripennis]
MSSITKMRNIELFFLCIKKILNLQEQFKEDESLTDWLKMILGIWKLQTASKYKNEENVLNSETHCMRCMLNYKKIKSKFQCNQLLPLVIKLFVNLMKIDYKVDLALNQDTKNEYFEKYDLNENNAILHYQAKEQTPENRTHLIKFNLKNGLLLKVPIEFFSKKVSFIYTCSFDSLFELLLLLYQNHKGFRLFLYDSAYLLKNSFFSTIIKYANLTYNTEDIYFNRGLILYPYGKVLNDNIIDCSINIINLYENLWENQFTIQRQDKCLTCGYQKVVHLHVVSISYYSLSDLISNKSTFIDHCLKSIFSEHLKRCRKCKNITLTETFKFGCFVVVDIENVSMNMTHTSNVPLFIIYKEKKFELFGFIAFKPGCQDSYSHYYSYYYNKNQKLWGIKDDLKLLTEYREILDNLKIALIIFIDPTML